MYRYTFNAGIGFTADNKPISSDELAMPLATIRAELARVFGGFTETDTVGGWSGENGNIVMEPGKQWICVTDSVQDGNTVARRIAQLLNQSAVMLTSESVETDFVSAVKPEVIEWRR